MAFRVKTTASDYGRQSFDLPDNHNIYFNEKRTECFHSAPIFLRYITV
ncbi:MAG TPA: hypothetical protein IAC95_00550 [Candidatus Fimimonas gallinarum]|uniref:Uncharacterized protein n=1 Tax=Candidatus Fimimonas gallinarum TaxID=2840821 RepID=A0A9D1E349_9BACT|nr:hypothetical protein [Candidatus Fimimonas gallinarum]